VFKGSLILIYILFFSACTVNNNIRPSNHPIVLPKNAKILYKLGDGWLYIKLHENCFIYHSSKIAIIPCNKTKKIYIKNISSRKKTTVNWKEIK